MKALKYFPAFTVPVFLWLSLSLEGIWSYSLFFYAFIFVPILEQVLPASEENMNKVEEQLAADDRSYDFLMYIMLPIQFGLLFYFLHQLQTYSWTTSEVIGKVLCMGIACGGFGINIAHELGHRHTVYEKLMSKALLLSSLYMHFFIEHNRGHHLQVATHNDPATARYGENFFFFYARSMVMGFISAWKLENKRLRKLGLSWFSWRNEMIWFVIIQIAFCLAIATFFSLWVVCCFIIAAFIGIMTLELVNYIEHYGLLRKQKSNGGYEKVLPIHSWNSNYFLGRLLLFELTRHSDHHYRPSRKYQTLRHFDDSPQMPAGYPAMMICALFPPIWFHIMHRQIDEIHSKYSDSLAKN